MRALDLVNTFETERFLLSLTGFYPKRSNSQRHLSFCRAFVNTLISYLQLISMIGQMVIDRRDLSKLTDTLVFFMTHITYICKLTNFVYYRKRLLDMEDELMLDPIYSKFSENKLKILLDKISGCKTVANTFRVVCVVCVFFQTVVPCLEKGKNLPLPGWIPYDANQFYYETAIFQIISVCITAYNNSTIDTLTWKLITIASGELMILRENLKEMVYHSETELKRCIEHHNTISSFIHKVEIIFSKGIFVQFLSSIVIICFTGFQLVVVPFGSRQFIFLIMYFFCMMGQVAMYCWYGHEVMTTSDDLGRSCYMSNWYTSDVKIQKNVIIFLERTKKPLSLTAGKFITLSLRSLTGILRSSYSYFAVLQHLYNKDS